MAATLTPGNHPWQQKFPQMVQGDQWETNCSGTGTENDNQAPANAKECLMTVSVFTFDGKSHKSMYTDASRQSLRLVMQE